MDALTLSPKCLQLIDQGNMESERKKKNTSKKKERQGLLPKQQQVKKVIRASEFNLHWTVELMVTVTFSFDLRWTL